MQAIQFFETKNAGQSPTNWLQISEYSNFAFHPEAREKCANEFLGTVAHEIGHSPGNNTEGSDHDELGIMGEGDAPLGADTFTPATILRFRKAQQWKE